MGFGWGWQDGMPQHTLSRILGFLSDCKIRCLKDLAIRIFVRYFNVDLTEAEVEDYTQFPTFNAFFTRALKKSARPLPPPNQGRCIISPVDGTVSAAGMIDDGLIFQAKGRDYALYSLVGGDSTLTERLSHGFFLTAYLSPKDYHRIHMPLAGRLLKMQYIPGRLFSVSPSSVENIDSLFARNERVVSTFVDDADRIFVVIAVGAMIVGSITTVWRGVVNTARPRRITTWDYAEKNIHLRQGEELGYFKLGSTVIVLLEKSSESITGSPAAAWDPAVCSGAALKMGQVVLNYDKPVSRLF